MRSPLEVEDPVTGIQIFSNSSFDKFISMTSVTYEGFIYVYAGHTGAVEQVRINNLHNDCNCSFIMSTCFSRNTVINLIVFLYHSFNLQMIL